MELRRLGPDGLAVTCIGYGTNMLGRPFDAARPNDAERTTESYYVSMVHAALDVGINLFDTANIYQDGRSEELLGLALEGRRDEAVIATKCGSRSRDFSAAAIQRECEDSLRRLRTDRIDLLMLHNPPLDDVERGDWAAGFDALISAGKVRVRGISVGAPHEGVRLMERGLVDVLQVNFNIFRVEACEEMLPMAAEKGVAVLVKIPMARGLLTGKYGSDTQFADGDWHAQGFVGEPDAMLRRIDDLDALADEEGMPLSELALRWVVGHEGVTAAIPGAKCVEHIRANAAAGHRGVLSDSIRAAAESIAHA